MLRHLRCANRVALGVEFVSLLPECRVLAAGVHPRLAKQGSVNLKTLHSEPVVSSLNWRRKNRDYWARASDGPNGNDRVPVPASGPVNGSTPWRMAGARLCPALLSDHYRRDDVTYLQLEGLSPNRIGLAWRRDRYRPVMSNFSTRR